MASLLDLPQELLEAIWQAIGDPASRRNFYSSCWHVRSASAITRHIAKVQVNLVQDTDPWHVSGGSPLGAANSAKVPLLLRLPKGARPHTLHIKGSGSRIDGPRLHRLLSLSSYEGEARRRADELLGGVRVLEVEVCNMEVAPASLPALLLANCPQLATLRILSHTKIPEPEVQEYLEREGLEVGSDSASGSDGDVSHFDGPEELGMFWVKQEERANYLLLRKGELMRRALRVLGGQVQTLEDLSNELGVLGQCFEGAESCLLPHVVMTKMSSACFEDLGGVLLPQALRSMPALRVFEVKRLHEMPLDEGVMCCDNVESFVWMMLEDLRLVEKMAAVQGRLEVRVQEFSLLNEWCPACMPLFLDGFDRLQNVPLLQGVQKLEFGQGIMGVDEMPRCALLMPCLTQLQFRLPRYLADFGQFLVSPFLYFRQLSQLEVSLDARSQMVDSRGNHTTVFMLRPELVNGMVAMGRTFLESFSAALGAHTGAPARRVSITLHFIAPARFKAVSLKTMQCLGAMMKSWHALEKQLFGATGKVQWQVSVHRYGETGTPTNIIFC